MKDSFIKELVNFGLSDKEAKVYVALLELEIGTAFEVAKHASLNRSSTYVVLEGLKKKGFVGVSEDNTVRKYIAASPDILLQSAKTESHRHAGIVEGIESIIPELKALYKDTKHKPVIKVFEGRNGIINAFEDILNSKEKKIRVISSIGKIGKLLPASYIPLFILKRIKKGIKMYGIHPDNTIEKMMLKVNSFDKPVLIPNEKFKWVADLAIYDNKVGYMTSDDGGIAVGIESKEIAEVMKNLFDLAYEEAKKISVNKK